MKCKLPCPEFELALPIPFTTEGMKYCLNQTILQLARFDKRSIFKESSSRAQVNGRVRC